MTREVYRALVKSVANNTREAVRGGSLFGLPIDMSNEDVVLVAAVAFARTEVWSRHDREMAAIREAGFLKAALSRLCSWIPRRRTVSMLRDAKVDNRLN